MSTAMRASESVHRPMPPVGTGYGPRDATRLGAVFRDAGRLAAPGFQDGRSTPGNCRRHAVSVPGLGNGPDARPAVCPLPAVRSTPYRRGQMGRLYTGGKARGFRSHNKPAKAPGRLGIFGATPRIDVPAGACSRLNVGGRSTDGAAGRRGANKESGEDAPPLSTEARDDLNPVAQGPIRCRRLRRLRDRRAGPR